MNYQFSRKRLAALAVCLVLLVILSFSAGVVAGIGLGMPAIEELAALKRKTATKGAAQHAAAPPSAKREPAEVEALSKGPDASVAPEASAATAVTPETATPERLVSESPADATGDDRFALQVGSFRDAGNAKQLQAELKDKGYEAHVITAMDADQREWHVVRMGSYKTLESAARAAATFTGKERMGAVVRHSNAL